MLKGSTTQDIFSRYQQQTIPLRHNIRTLDRAYIENSRIEDFKTLQEQQIKLENLTKEFIKNNRNLAVNLHLAELLKKSRLLTTKPIWMNWQSYSSLIRTPVPR